MIQIDYASRPEQSSLRCDLPPSNLCEHSAYAKRACPPSTECLLARTSSIPKFVFGVYVLVWWGLKQRMNTQPTDIAFSVILVLALVTLMFTQVYGSWIVWKISMTVEQRFKPAINDAELQDDDKTPVGSGASSLIHPSVLRKYSDSSDSGSTAA